MTFRNAMCVTVAVCALVPAAARAQSVNTAWGAYTGGVHLSLGQFAPLQLDASGNLLVNVAAGGSPSGGTASTVNQGTAGSASGGWYVQPGTGATFPVSIATLPPLAAGSAAIGTVGVTSLPALPAGTNTIGNVTRTTPSPQDTSAGTVTALASTAVSGSTSTTIVPAATGTRWRATIYNTSTQVVWARADGGTAAIGTGIPIPAGGAYEWVYPLTGAAPAPAINAIMATATAGTVSGEYVQ